MGPENALSFLTLRRWKKLIYSIMTQRFLHFLHERIVVFKLLRLVSMALKGVPLP